MPGEGICKACQAEIVWLKTFSGKNIPVDRETVEDDNEIFNSKRHRCHFETCPEGGKFRTNKKSDQVKPPDPEIDLDHEAEDPQAGDPDIELPF